MNSISGQFLMESPLFILYKQHEHNLIWGQQSCITHLLEYTFLHKTPKNFPQKKLVCAFMYAQATFLTLGNLKIWILTKVPHQNHYTCIKNSTILTDS